MRWCIIYTVLSYVYYRQRQYDNNEEYLYNNGKSITLNFEHEDVILINDCVIPIY